MKTKKVNGHWKIFLLFTFLAIILLLFIKSNNYKPTIQSFGVPTTTPFPTPISQPITKASSTKGFVVYENSEHKYQIEVPEGSILYRENLNAGSLGRTTYTSIFSDEKSFSKEKAYSVDISVTDLTEGKDESNDCKSNLQYFQKINFNGMIAYKGRAFSGGESAPVRSVLCLEKGMLQFAIIVGENKELLGNKILDSFRFTNE